MKTPPDKRVDLSALSAWAPQLAEAFVSLASDIALVLHTSGSTGRAKRVPIMHSNITASASQNVPSE